MPKTIIDYSNTIIYKITCYDPNINDIYVGHTTNFVQRKHAHKMCSANNSNKYKCKLYEVIRKNGGWENWKMEIVDFFNCENHLEARKREQEYFISLKATLNSIEPLPSYNQHISITPNEKKNDKNSELLNQSDKKQSSFLCEKCSFRCCKQSIYNKHLETFKHKRRTHIQFQPVINTTSTYIENNVKNKYTCEYCLKSYKYHSGLWRHKMACTYKAPYVNADLSTNSDIYDEPDNIGESFDNDTDTSSQTENFIINKSSSLVLGQIATNQIKNLTNENREMKMNMKLMMQMMANNAQFQSQILDMMKSSSKSSVSSDTIQTSAVPAIASSGDNAVINSHNNNNTFNMNLFLNEQCKDAMNMKDFVNSIQLNITDLENVGRLGYVEGMSNILIDNLQKTDVYKRPVHCSDVKRETLYVKDDNKWEREGPEHEKMVNAVLAVEHKNVALVSEWAKANPSCMNSYTRENETYFKLSKVATDGEKDGNIAKVIRRVAKKVVIEKE